MLEINRLQSGYGGLQILWDVTLNVSQGEFVVLLGPNGAGKTTTLRTIAGVLAPMGGEVLFKGQSIGGLPAHLISQLGISFVTEDLNLFPKMSVVDNLLVGGHANKNSKKTRQSLEYVISLFPRLKERLNQLAGTLSGGERKMLALGRGLMSDPELILVDEPSLGLSPLMTQVAFNALNTLNLNGVSILLVEQHLGKALEMTSRGYVLEHGQIVLHGATSELLESVRVKEVYLGKYSEPAQN